MTFVVKNACFDLTVLLTPEQLNFFVLHPDAYSYIEDVTDGIKLGRNTLVQNNETHIYGPTSTEKYRVSGSSLHFENRLLPSTGLKNLRVVLTYPEDPSPTILQEFTYLCSSLKKKFKQTTIGTLYEKTSSFDLIYTLTDFEKNNTLIRFPQGAFYLHDETENINLGNNTLVQNDFRNMNLFGPETTFPDAYKIDGNILRFANRFITSTGHRQLRIWFYNGSTGSYPVSPFLYYHSYVLPPDQIGYIQHF